jgi:hypothetical protein
MPTTPPLDGLPFPIQLLLTLLFGVAALAVAFRGYFTKGQRPSVTTTEPHTAAFMAASIMDTGAVRHLSDVCIQLTGAVTTLKDTIEESTHYDRMRYELEREMVARLRELKEELARQGRDTRAWDKRDEGRK